MKLHTIKPPDGSIKKKKRIGRGQGSKKGTTAGRGNKGQQSRSGYSSSFREGGQMPIYRRQPKVGFNSPSRKEFKILNLKDISNLLKKEKLLETITIQDLVNAKVIGKRDKVKVLGIGEGIKISIEVNSVSGSAKEKIEKLGGKVIIKN